MVCLNLSKSIPLKMELQVSHCFRSQGTAQGLVWASAPLFGNPSSCVGPTEGVSDSRGTRDAGPCTHVYGDSSEAPGGFGHRVSQGQKCHCDRSAVMWQRTQLYRAALLGSGLCCLYARIGSAAGYPILP